MKYYKLKGETAVLILIRNKKNEKKIVPIGDSIMNGISEEGLSVNYKVKIVNFPGSTWEKILEKLDDIIKEIPDDLMVHVGTNDITNKVSLLTNV